MTNKYGKNFVSDFHLWYTSRDISTCEERRRLMNEKYHLDEEEDVVEDVQNVWTLG